MTSAADLVLLLGLVPALAVAGVVADTPGYNAWPMVQAVGGKLFCAYSRGSGHSIVEGRRDAFARVSADGGRTWGREVVVSADPDEGEVMIGKGLDSSGAALFWVRCLGKSNHHDLYRTVDGESFEKIATPSLDPFPMQVTDIVKVNRGLLCLWFQTDYGAGSKSSWGTLLSPDDGRTWVQKTVERDLALPDLPTEPSFVNLGNGRLLGIARTEIAGDRGGRQFQLVSTDEGLTWRKTRTNISDIRMSTPSLVLDRETGFVYNYHYERGKGKVKRRVVRAAEIFDSPESWPEPTVVAYGREERPHDAGNVNATVLGRTHCLAYYFGTRTNAAVHVVSAAENMRFADWKSRLPRPIFDEKPELVELYDKTWEIAHTRIDMVPGIPAPRYMDEAHRSDRIWIWDTCFMVHFCKYCPDEFPGIESLEN